MTVLLYKFVNLIATLVICLKFVFIEMLDKRNYIHSVLVEDFVSGLVCCVNKPQNNSSNDMTSWQNSSAEKISCNVAPFFYHQHLVSYSLQQAPPHYVCNWVYIANYKVQSFIYIFSWMHNSRSDCIWSDVDGLLQRHNDT
jgi:hypothetical protein